MASILLPSSPGVRGASPMLMSFGGLLTPFLGGPSQRINRLGTRWAMQFTLPPIAAAQAGAWVSAFAQSVDRGAIMRIPQDIDVGMPGAPTLSASVTSGTALPLKGMTPGYVIKSGQWLSVIRAGRRYSYIFAADGVVSGAGTVTASIWPMIRVGLLNNDIVEIAEPKIEGWLDGQFEYAMLQVPYVQFPDFTITERA